MESVLNKIRALIETPMKEMDIIVDNIEWVIEGKYKYLKITLDRVNGIDIDTIVDATNIINPILDEHDLIKDEYILDISSKERG
jgi:ribosome maturation factor RimP